MKNVTIVIPINEKINVSHLAESVLSASLVSDNVTQDEYELLKDIFAKIESAYSLPAVESGVFLTPEKSEEIFLNSLCNGMSYIQGHGIELVYKYKDYSEANKKLDSPCFENVLMQILKDGKKLMIVDREGDGEMNAEITLADVHSMVQRVDEGTLGNILMGNDDAVDADSVIQTVFYKKIIFG